MKLRNSASIRANLFKKSKNEELIFQQVVTRYLHERLLYRLSLSEYKSRFILKGGNLLYALEGLHVRPTVDIDVLAKHIANDKESLIRIFNDICNIRYDEDCVHFDSSNIIALDIAEEKKYSGIRLLIKTRFDTMKQSLQVDVGFGDIIIPAPVLITYPTLLHELNPPDIMAYSIETVIAEKFHAMITLGDFNSRMKDFYDVYLLLKNKEINNNHLQEAIWQTFKQRGVVFEDNHRLFSQSFRDDPKRQIMWKAFLRKANVSEDLEFPYVVKSIVEHLQSFYNELSPQLLHHSAAI